MDNTEKIDVVLDSIGSSFTAKYGDIAGETCRKCTFICISKDSKHFGSKFSLYIYPYYDFVSSMSNKTIIGLHYLVKRNLERGTIFKNVSLIKDERTKKSNKLFISRYGSNITVIKNSKNE